MVGWDDLSEDTENGVIRGFYIYYRLLLNDSYDDWLWYNESSYRDELMYGEEEFAQVY